MQYFKFFCRKWKHKKPFVYKRHETFCLQIKSHEDRQRLTGLSFMDNLLNPKPIKLTKIVTVKQVLTRKPAAVTKKVVKLWSHWYFSRIESFVRKVKNHKQWMSKINTSLCQINDFETFSVFFDSGHRIPITFKIIQIEIYIFYLSNIRLVNISFNFFILLVIISESVIL